MATNEALIQDEELDALMAELEAETADMVVQPVITASKPEPTPEPVQAPTPVVEVKAQPVASQEDEDLEKMLAEIDNVDVVEDVVAPVEEPTPEPAPTPTETPKPTLVRTPVPTPLPKSVTAPTTSSANTVLKHFIDVRAFAAEMKVSETTLDQAMMEQASLRAYHGAEAAHAEAQHAFVKRRFEKTEAQLWSKYRKSFIESGEKATEKMIENAVKIDPAWLEGINLVIEAETIAAVRKSCAASLGDRRDMIIQMGADRREEGKGAVRTMANQAAHTDIRSRAIAAAQTANG